MALLLPWQCLDWLWKGKFFLTLALTSDFFNGRRGSQGLLAPVWYSDRVVLWFAADGWSFLGLPGCMCQRSCHPVPLGRDSKVSCKAGCYVCTETGEQFEWTLIRNKFEDLQYLSSGRRYTLLGNTSSSSSCPDEGQTREKRNSSSNCCTSLLLQTTAKHNKLCFGINWSITGKTWFHYYISFVFLALPCSCQAPW